MLFLAVVLLVFVREGSEVFARNVGGHLSDEFAIDVTKLADSEALMTQTLGRTQRRKSRKRGQNFAKKMKDLAEAVHACGSMGFTDMKLHKLRNTSVTCNDGSPAGYYLRRSHGSKRWLLFLEGGWYCFDQASCRNRWANMANLMSSKRWPDRQKGSGILSPDPEENPYWWNANTVYVPYCSSDVWSGMSPRRDKDDFAFMGALILQEVLRELLPLGLKNSKTLLLSGSSAGGTGVILNLDRSAEFLRREGSSVQVQGVADSGWFLDNKQYMPTECTETLSCAPSEAIRRGIQWWNGQVPERCARQYSRDEQWRCFFGYRAYPTLQAPLFVIQWLFDEAQMIVNNVGTPVDKEQWNYIHNLGVDLRKTLTNVTGVFAPACLAHTLITKSDWMTVKMKGVSLPNALHCWEQSVYKAERPLRHNRHRKHREEASPMADDPSSYANERKDRRRDGKDGGAKDLGSGDPVERTGRREGRRGRRRNRRNRRNRKQRSLLWGRAEPQESTCVSQLVDSCPWPHCNPTCPKLRNPFTGEEMDFIPLMMELVGIDMNAIAEQMGMDPDDLVRMLTS
ncbi:palmitoleoyl-protein carboxylesterase NOTUM-like isoform X2 [Branchiostoma lanceolatum]|uniref:palmitoleoyl-protein carboxylesterase NOTUM-like isoform X2 n=1 Tax=Branchiostoma lanceolatum TaxID=7740 RepID=UPI00345449B6